MGLIEWGMLPAPFQKPVQLLVNGFEGIFIGQFSPLVQEFANT
jgi:hypothetical protein